MNDAEVEVGGLKRRVGLWHMHFWNGGSWSYFLCPNCGRKCQKLRLHDGRLTCRLCDGLGRDRGKNIESIRQKLAGASMRHDRSIARSLTQTRPHRQTPRESSPDGLPNREC